MDIIEFARLGGQARAKKLTASRRQEIARNAINKRWGILASKNSKANEPILASKNVTNSNTCIIVVPNGTVCNRPSNNHFGMSHNFTI